MIFMSAILKSCGNCGKNIMLSDIDLSKIAWTSKTTVVAKSPIICGECSKEHTTGSTFTAGLDGNLYYIDGLGLVTFWNLIQSGALLTIDNESVTVSLGEYKIRLDDKELKSLKTEVVINQGEKKPKNSSNNNSVGSVTIGGSFSGNMTFGDNNRAETMVYIGYTQISVITIGDNIMAKSKR